MRRAGPCAIVTISSLAASIHLLYSHTAGTNGHMDTRTLVLNRHTHVHTFINYHQATIVILKRYTVYIYIYKKCSNINSFYKYIYKSISRDCYIETV